jgi:hypothetical protein
MFSLDLGQSDKGGSHSAVELPRYFLDSCGATKDMTRPRPFPDSCKATEVAAIQLHEFLGAL